MYQGKKIVAMIPARGGSKGIPGKNIYPVLGKPLIQYTIDAALSCEYIDEVVVSTDDLAIAECARDLGASVPFLRPKALATDRSKTIDGVMFMLEHMDEKYDVLILLQPTSPLRDSQDVGMAIERYFGLGEKDLVSISKVNESPVLIREKKEDGLKKLLNENSTIRRQDMKEYYLVNGAIYINNIKRMDVDTSFNDNAGFVCMSRSHSIDVDTLEDIVLCEYYLTKKSE